jgi:CubicO group peptidase (beta-lactamase class C family)
MNRRQIVAAAVAVVVGIGAALLVGPRPQRLPDRATGDGALAARARAALGPGHDQVAVALVEDGRVRLAGFGADGDTAFEIGSVTKALTGMLLADQVEAGAVRLEQPVGELTGGTPLAGARATLRELAQHRSGLPRLPRDAVLRSLGTNLSGGDPYRGGSAEVFAAAADAGAPGGAEPAYSNLGFAVLGDALAAARGTTYAELLRSRLLEPLGLDRTTVVTDPARLPADRATGADAHTGRGQDPWIAEGWAPAGIGTWSTAADLARLAAAVLDGSAPGAAAARPTSAYRDDGDRIGLAWITSTERGRTLTWHNGGTGGFHSYVGLDPAAGRAVVVLSASTASVDAAGVELLTGSGS